MMKKFDAIKRALLVVVLALAQTTANAQRTTTTGSEPTTDEEREARELAAVFAEKLLKTNDFAPVVEELYVADFFPRYFKSQKDWMERAPASEFMIEGVPSLTFKRSLLTSAESEYWPRLYAAANTFLHVGFVSVMARSKLTEELNFDLNEMYPPEVFELFKKNPLLANFVRKQGDDVIVETEKQLQEVTTTMEEAARLAREHVNRQLAKDRGPLDENLKIMGAGLSASEVKLLSDKEAAEFGYPKGTRLFRVQPPIWYDLIVVREGNGMKILWANAVHD